MSQLFINNNTTNYDLYKEDISDLNQSQKHLLDYILIQGEKFILKEKYLFD